MRHACLVVAAILACACSRVDSGTDPGGGCISSTTWATAARTLDLSVNDSSMDGGAGSLRLAQSFLVTGDTGTTKSVVSVLLPLYLNAAATLGGNTTLKLFTDNSGVPGTAVSNSTVTMASSQIGATAPTNITFTFGTVISLTAGSTYWIVLDATYAQTTTPVIKWAADDANVNSSAYSSGAAKYEGDGTPDSLFRFGTMGQLRELGFSIECQ